MADIPPPVPFKILPGFAVPFAEIEVPDATTLNPQLRALILEREGEGSIYRNPSPTMTMPPQVFESRFDLFHWPEACVVKLREFCNAALFKMVGELSGYGQQDLAELRLFADAWFHVTRTGGAFGMHNHPMASWSGVYCVDSGYGAEAPESGELNFMHPAATAGMFVDLGVANIRAPWAIRPKSYRLRPGQLILFPSWVMHQVLPYHGSCERVTVAFNVWFQRTSKEKEK